MEFRAKVYVTPKPAILDPQGKAVAGSLRSLGYDEVGDVRLGKYLEVAVSGSDRDAVGERVDEMCRRLLANDIIENYRFEIEEAAAE